MWRIDVVIAYFALALLIPVAWMALNVWRRTSQQRKVTCPQTGAAAMIGLDICYAVRMRALGNPEPLVRHCSRWPAAEGCGQECRNEIGRAV